MADIHQNNIPSNHSMQDDLFPISTDLLALRITSRFDEFIDLSQPTFLDEANTFDGHWGASHCNHKAANDARNLHSLEIKYFYRYFLYILT